MRHDYGKVNFNHRKRLECDRLLCDSLERTPPASDELFFLPYDSESRRAVNRYLFVLLFGCAIAFGAMQHVYATPVLQDAINDSEPVAAIENSVEEQAPGSLKPEEEAVASEGPQASGPTVERYPFLVLVVGIATVLGLIIVLKVNAFLSLVIAALLVSLMVGGNPGLRMDAVVSAFGKSAGDIGIVIAMAAIIGKCMLDSGAADRIVRAAVNFTGEKKAPVGLMASGFVLGIPVFFDTVFYLLVPLARSLFKRTGKNYLRYLLAISTGGAITHTLVPPTPGPLLVSATLGVDIGMMIFVGLMVAFPTAIAGLLFAYFLDAKMPIPMRSLGTASDKQEPVSDDKLPSMAMSLMPIVLPMVLIGFGTLVTTLADREDKAQLTADQIEDFDGFVTALRLTAGSEGPNPADRFLQSKLMPEEVRTLILGTEPIDPGLKDRVIQAFDATLSAQDVYDEAAFRMIGLSGTAKNLVAGQSIRTKPVDRRRMNRLLLEESFPGVVKPHEWESPMRVWAERTRLWSNANFALLLAALVSIWTLMSVRGLTLRETAGEVEESLMSGGVIILITAAGGAFGAMLRDARIGESIQALFQQTSAGGIGLILLAYVISAVLKIAQGSSTVAMIVAAGMIGAISNGMSLDFHPVYLGLAVGTGSLLGSWMNDSGFWVFAKMGGLTEGEALKSWTVLLVVLSCTGLAVTILLSQVLPFAA